MRARLRAASTFARITSSFSAAAHGPRRSHGIEPGMSRAHHSGGEPSQRMLRVAELIRHEIADLLGRGGLDPILERQIVTVPKVKMSPDLKLATIYVVPLGGKDPLPILEALGRCQKQLRGEIARRVNLRAAPEIRFKTDEAFENSAKIDALLNSEKVRRDLGRGSAD
jgi:ribosome-binding factor A